MNLDKIQHAIKEAGVDGWLFYDFHNRDPLAYRVLGLDFSIPTSRRWFYLIPAEGEPRGLYSLVEPVRIAPLPGRKTGYRTWPELGEGLDKLLSGMKNVAMQYSPDNNMPHVSMVDAGTIESIRKRGIEVSSSADLLQLFESILDEGGIERHCKAAAVVDRVRREAFRTIESRIREGRPANEHEIQQLIMKRIGENGMTFEDHLPIVGTGDHPANPHFGPTEENSRPIDRGATILIDLWAKCDEPGGIYYDSTWCAFAGEAPPRKYAQIFGVVVAARKRAVDFVRERFAAGKAVHGWEVDDVCREVVEEAGFAEWFVHRTGHSIGEDIHGSGVNIDNFETRDERRIVPGCCFSIEPGIYLEGEMAVRSEICVYVDLTGEIKIAGEEQEELILLEV